MAGNAEEEEEESSPSVLQTCMRILTTLAGETRSDPRPDKSFKSFPVLSVVFVKTLFVYNTSSVRVSIGTVSSSILRSFLYKKSCTHGPPPPPLPPPLPSPPQKKKTKKKQKNPKNLYDVSANLRQDSTSRTDLLQQMYVLPR